MSKQLEIEQLLKQLKLIEEYTNPEQRKYYDKLNSISKQLFKCSKQFSSQSNPQFLSSLRIQLCNLKKYILNNKKQNMSDYQAFLWKYQLYKSNKEFFSYISKKQLIQKITLPKRGILSTFQKQSMIQQLKKIEFCPLGYTIPDIINFSNEILFSNHYCQKNFEKQTISKFLTQISKEYQIVSYHNFTHAFSVQLMLCQCLNTSQLMRTTFTDFQIFISYLAALAHDMGHYGTNSDFQVKQKSEIAVLYSNQSVLENMHVASFCKMLRRYPQIDIISQIKDPVERQRGKRLLIKLILGTDVTKHFDGLNKIKGLQITGQSKLEIHQKQNINQNIFHACDIGNCCLPYKDFMNWALLLSYEFNSQYQLQERQGLQQTAMFRYEGEKGFYKGQIGFIDYLAMPLWKSLGQVFPELAIFSKNIQINRKNLQISLENLKD